MDLLLLHARSIVRIDRSQKVHIVVRVEAHDVLVVREGGFLIRKREPFLQTCPFLCRDRRPAADGGQFARGAATMKVHPKHYFPTMMFSITVVSDLRYRINEDNPSQQS